MKRPKGWDLTGGKYGKLEVLTPAGEDDLLNPFTNLTRWRCQCTCGNEKPRVIASNLVYGLTQSCGCGRRA